MRDAAPNKSPQKAPKPAIKSVACNIKYPHNHINQRFFSQENQDYMTWKLCVKLIRKRESDVLSLLLLLKNIVPV